MLDLQYGTPAIVFETERSPQCYMGAASEITVDRPAMAELLTRIGKINAKYDSAEDIKKVLDEAMENYMVTAEAYVSENPYNAGMTRLNVLIPQGYNEFGESYGDKCESVRLDAGEITDIYDTIVKMMDCKDRKEFSEKIHEIVDARLSSSTFDLRALDTNVYRCYSQNEVGKDGCIGDSHLHCDFYLPHQTQAELLMKTGYLKEHTLYYKGNYMSLASYENDIDINVRFKYSADLYTDGTGTLTISQYDIRATHQFERDYNRPPAPADLPKFCKEKMTVSLKENEVENIKSAIDRYQTIHGMTITANEILENIERDNLSKRPEKIFMVSTEHMDDLIVGITDVNENKDLNNCVSLVDTVHPPNAKHGFCVISVPFSQTEECRDMIESIYGSDYSETFAAIGERTILQCDSPYIGKLEFTSPDNRGTSNCVEAFVDLNESQINSFLSRCILQYSDNGDIVRSVNDLRKETKIDVFAQIDKSGNTSLIMQIEGATGTQSNPVKINLTEKEQICVKNAIEDKCKENEMSLNKLRSLFQPRNRSIIKEL